MGYEILLLIVLIIVLAFFYGMIVDVKLQNEQMLNKLREIEVKMFG